MRAVALVAALALTAFDAVAQDSPPAERPAPEVPRAPRRLRTWREAMTLAESRSVDARIAGDEVERARAQQEIALSAVVPSLSGSGTAVHNQLTQSVATVDVGSAAPSSLVVPTPNVLYGALTGTQAVLDFGAWHGVLTARVNAGATRAAAANTRRTVARGAADSILVVVASEHIATLNRVGLRAALDRLDVVRHKQALGVGNGLDVARVQRDVDDARDTLATGDEALHRSREALGLALGLDGEIGVEGGPGGAEAWANEASAECRRIPALEERDDVRAARGQAFTADNRVTDAALRLLPVVGAQTTLAQTSDPSVLPQTTWSIQATVTVPIWDGGARHGAIREARALRDEADARLFGLRREVGVEVERAERAIATATERQAIAAHARAVAATTDTLTRQAYAMGQGSSLELVTAAASLRESEIELALRDFDLLRAHVDFAFATSTCAR